MPYGEFLLEQGMELEHESGLTRNCFNALGIWEYPPSEWEPGKDYTDHLEWNADWRSVVGAFNGKPDIYTPCPLGQVCRDPSPGTGLMRANLHGMVPGWQPVHRQSRPVPISAISLPAHATIHVFQILLATWKLLLFMADSVLAESG